MPTPRFSVAGGWRNFSDRSVTTSLPPGNTGGKDTSTLAFRLPLAGRFCAARGPEATSPSVACADTKTTRAEANQTWGARVRIPLMFVPFSTSPSAQGLDQPPPYDCDFLRLQHPHRQLDRPLDGRAHLDARRTV